jgi:hypothetical protein
MESCTMNRFLPPVVLAIALSGCSSSKVVHAPVGVTVGQQLIDLKQAHSKGALSDREYEQQRKRLIDSVR